MRFQNWRVNYQEVHTKKLKSAWVMNHIKINLKNQFAWISRLNQQVQKGVHICQIFC
jgi:phage pi2 protein 07